MVSSGCGPMMAGGAFGLATLIEGDKRVAALAVDGFFWVVGALGSPPVPRSVRDMLDRWDEVLPILGDLARQIRSGHFDPRSSVTAAAARLGAPIEYPNKVIGVAANYGDFFRQQGAPAVPWSPTGVFSRPPTTTVVGPGATTPMPFGGTQLDWEVELAVVMGARMRGVSPARAMAGVAGYTVAIDFTVKDLVAVANGFKTDLFRGKCQDGLSPLGPILVPAAFIADPQALALRLSVNGEQRQQGSTSDMLTPIAALISDISHTMTWEPGDVLLSGTPGGGGDAWGAFLKAGDVVAAEIDGIGRLEVTIQPPFSARVGI